MDSKQVPVTDEMIEAGHSHLAKRHHIISPSDLASAFEAMLAAAPAPSPVEPEAGELLPCPFCGGQAENHPDCAMVGCDKCGVELHHNSPEQAITAWNRRAPAEDAFSPPTNSAQISGKLVGEPDGGELLSCPCGQVPTEIGWDISDGWLIASSATCCGQWYTCAECPDDADGDECQRLADESWNTANRRAPAEDGNDFNQTERYLAEAMARKAIKPEHPSPENDSMAATAYRYLELRGLLEHHPDDKSLVRIKENGK